MGRSFFFFILIAIKATAMAQVPAAHVVSLQNGKGPSIIPELKLWNDSFVSADYQATNEKNFGFLGANLKTTEDNESIARADIEAAFAMTAPLMSYLKFTELFLAIPISQSDGAPQPLHLDLGRKRSSWSELDARWNLGVWEPVFKWNPLTPERQGLTGIFLVLPWDKFEMEFMGSPLYLPDQGPNFQVNERGEFERGNPWFRRPADSIRIWSETSKVQYNFRRPSETAVVSQNSYSTRARLKLESFFAQASYAFKPMNQLPLAYDGSLDIANDKGVVDIVTSVQYHEVMGVDLGWKAGAFTLGLSALRDRPFGEAEFKDTEKDKDQWTRPIYRQAQLYSPYFDVNFGSGWTSQFQYLTIEGGEVQEVGPLANPKRPSITRRYPFTQAQSFSLSYQGRRFLKRPWQSSIAYMLGTKENFDTLRWQGHLQVNRMWSVFAETLMVRAGNQTKETQSEIAEFENHDRLLIGAGYVF